MNDKRRLQVRRETLRTLDVRRLGLVAGGILSLRCGSVVCNDACGYGDTSKITEPPDPPTQELGCTTGGDDPAP